ncbi:hypothetical protein [Arthrobacter sp. G119Y2]|uniref:hypothetical protein n=1 Tax=Arthrobacter sp. G119Y2 TaxID=3134965 RepID=UPI00311A1C93
MTTTEINSFHEGGAKIGGLIRHLSEDRIQTTLAFRIPSGPVVHLFQETRFAANVFGWSAYRYVDHLQNIKVQVRAAEQFGERDARTPIPSYAAHLVLREFLASAAPQREFRQFHEDDPSTAVSASFVRRGPDTIQTRGARGTPSRLSWRSTVARGNTFWCVDGVPVKSDWQGATSYPATAGFVLPGLDADVLSILKGVLTGIEG